MSEDPRWTIGFDLQDKNIVLMAFPHAIKTNIDRRALPTGCRSVCISDTGRK